MFERKLTLVLTMVAIATTGTTYAEPMRDSINIAGSSTVSPFTMAVGERFNKATQFNLPQIQAIGTGAGLKLFCAGTGIETLDIANAVRPMNPAEKEMCEKNGVKDMIEIKFGNVGTVIVQSNAGEKFTNLTRKELFLAMAKDVPDPKGGAKLVPNPYKTWKDINPTLPNTQIVMWVPAAIHGTHDIVMNQIMLVGCKQIGSMQTLTANDPKTLEAACQNVRKDGAYIEFDKYDMAIKELEGNPNALGIMANTKIEQNLRLITIPIDGYEPLASSIAHHVYPLTESLSLYVKKSNIHVVKGLKEYLTELTSEEAIGTNRGYLGKMGMVTLPLTDRKQARASIAELPGN
ncbi:MAG: substrate-binding domain-containing protein [Candidatus Competibacteraceae bacterium]|nr:substrate-binding domain-containing protein [Candidatus Competibacteraceae bacterium]